MKAEILTDQKDSKDISEDYSDAESIKSIELNVDLEALQKSASEVFGRSCISVSKLSEGGFHKIYLLLMENGEKYIGRVAFPEYPYWKTESEVAVMKYVREKTSIRAPKVYYWNSSKENPVGQEYIIMERLPGISLQKVWDKYNMDEKKMILLQVIEIQCILKKQTFTSIGGIFLDETDEFKIGQVVEESFFIDKRADLNIDRGPFQNTYDYMMAAINKEIVYKQSVYTPEQKEKFIPVYKELATLISKYFSHDNKDNFVLIYNDFHPTNIIVDGIKIIGLVDWECSGSYPLECLCDYPIWITDNPKEGITKEKSEENFILQEFWRKEMKERDPEFIQIMTSMDNVKDQIYNLVLIDYYEGAGKVLQFLEKLHNSEQNSVD